MIFKDSEFFCVLDIETTDRYWSSCAPIQLAAEVYDKYGNVMDTFNERIKTTHKITPDASRVHGIYAKDLVGCRSEKAVLTDFCAWLHNWNVDLILTYNGEAFDRRVLNNRCEVLGVKTDYFNAQKFPGVDVHMHDVHPAKKQNLFGLKEIGRKWNLVLVSSILGFDTSNAHDAFADVKMTKQVFFKLDPIIHPESWEDEK